MTNMVVTNEREMTMRSSFFLRWRRESLGWRMGQIAFCAVALLFGRPLSAQSSRIEVEVEVVAGPGDPAELLRDHHRSTDFVF